MNFKTKGIVLKTIKYGETSIVANIFTESFGLQTYLVNGVRSNKKSSSKANLFQSAAILDMVVYHNNQKNLQRIKEFKWFFLYENVLTDVIKNNVALYMVELLLKCLKHPEQNTDLFNFFEDTLHFLDKSNSTITANLPLYFSLQLSHFFGFKMDVNSSVKSEIFYIDLKEGVFSSQQPQHPHFITGEPAIITAELLKAIHPADFDSFKLNHEIRRKLLLSYQEFYALHIQDFGQMKTLAVLDNVL